MSTFIRSLVGCGVHKAIMEIDGVEESGGPKLRRESGSIEESPNFNGQGVVVDLGAAILGRAIRTGAFNNIAEVLEHRVTECVTAGEFSALIRTDNAVTRTVL
jgi:hypothetical protein